MTTNDPADPSRYYLACTNSPFFKKVILIPLFYTKNLFFPSSIYMSDSRSLVGSFLRLSRNSRVSFRYDHYHLSICLIYVLSLSLSLYLNDEACSPVLVIFHLDGVGY